MTRHTPPSRWSTRRILTQSGLMILLIVGFAVVERITGRDLVADAHGRLVSALPGRERIVPVAVTVGWFVAGIACLLLVAGPVIKLTHRRRAKGEPEPAGALSGGIEPSAKPGSDNELIQADIDRALWGGLLGAVAGAIGGAAIAAQFAGGTISTILLGSLGALVGAPLGLLIGALLAWLVPEVLAGIVLLVFILFVRVRNRRTRIGSFAATPNPVTAGNRVTLTAVAKHPRVTEVDFSLPSLQGKTVLGCGTKTSTGVWELSLAVSLAPGLYTLVAQAQDAYGRSGQPVTFELTVQ